MTRGVSRLWRLGCGAGFRHTNEADPAYGRRQDPLIVWAWGAAVLRPYRKGMGQVIECAAYRGDG
jgi:hypothetical protein